MRDITDLKVTQIRLYTIDLIPFASLLLSKNLSALRDRLQFKRLFPAEEGERPTLIFEEGEMEHAGTSYLIERLVIQHQKVLLVAYAGSTACNAIYTEVEKIFAAPDPNKRFEGALPSVTTEETSCNVTLDVDFRRLFSPSLLQLLERHVQPATSGKQASSTVVPTKFSARISYEILDPSITKAGIRLVEKSLTIEPRVRTELDEHRYHTQSPTDSDTHLRLLTEFEHAFAG